MNLWKLFNLGKLKTTISQAPKTGRFNDYRKQFIEEKSINVIASRVEPSGRQVVRLATSKPFKSKCGQTSKG